MSKTTFGRPLDFPVKQTVLPVIAKPSGRIYGFLMIPLTQFDGSETEYTTADGTMPLTTVTMPTHNKIVQGREVIGHSSSMPVQQYVAAAWDDNELVSADNRGTNIVRRPWVDQSGFIDVADSGFAGTFFSQATSGWQARLQLGTLVESLIFGTPTTTVTPAPNPDLEPEVSMNWIARISQSVMTGECPFFRMNWLQLFNIKLDKDKANNYVPQRLNIVQVPAGFKAFLVKTPTVIPGTNVFYDTLQIVIIDKSLVAGDYDFNFSVEVEGHQPVPVTLTLTITPV